jgi:hypothetical protein
VPHCAACCARSHRSFLEGQIASLRASTLSRDVQRLLSSAQRTAGSSEGSALTVQALADVIRGLDDAQKVALRKALGQA